jgi:anti-sigma factor RsiW
MNCDEALQKLTDHHNETLPADEAVAIAEHLGSCGSCAQAYCRLQAQLRGIAAAYAERPSDKARAALRSAVRKEFAPKPSRRVLEFLRRPVPAYGAALAAAIPLVAWIAVAPAEPDAASPGGTAQPPAPARIHDYDATVPLFDRSMS